MQQKNDIALLKLQNQTSNTPRLIVADFDGTLFTPNIKIIAEVLHHNKQLKKLLLRQHIPLIINTAKRDWLKKEKNDARILGISPDVIIVGAGTKIYHKTIDNKLVLDTEWQTKIRGTQLWNSKSIEDRVNEWREKHKITMRKIKDSDFQVRYRVRHVATRQLPVLAASLQKQFDSGIQVVYTESVYSNKFGFQTGDILIIPAIAGKDNALQYLLEKYSEIVQKQIDAYCFGDGSIDLLSFLTMPLTANYVLKQFLIHPTALAKYLFENESSSHKPTLLKKSGAVAMMDVLSTVI